MESVMKAAIYISGVVALLAFSEAHGQPGGETYPVFSVGINIPGLHLTADDLRTGAGCSLDARFAGQGRRKSDRPESLA